MAGNVLTADFGVLLSTHERAAGGWMSFARDLPLIDTAGKGFCWVSSEIENARACDYKAVK